MVRHLLGMVLSVCMVATADASAAGPFVSTDAIIREVRSVFPDAVSTDKDTSDLFSPFPMPDDSFPLTEYRILVAYRMRRLEGLGVAMPKFLNADMIGRFSPTMMVVAMRVLDRTEKAVSVQ